MIKYWLNVKLQNYSPPSLGKISAYSPANGHQNNDSERVNKKHEIYYIHIQHLYLLGATKWNTHTSTPSWKWSQPPLAPVTQPQLRKQKGYKSQGDPKQEHYNEVRHFSNVVSLFQLTAKPVQEDHIEEECEPDMTEKQEASDQPPYLEKRNYQNNEILLTLHAEQLTSPFMTNLGWYSSCKGVTTLSCWIS